VTATGWPQDQGPEGGRKGDPVIDSDLRKLLIAQIGNELATHQLYMAIALYFDRKSLKRWGKLFHDQAIEEAQHAQKIMDFLIDNEIDFDLPALKSTSTRFDSALAAARRALQSEKDVAAQFDRMAAVAAAAGDHRGHQFLQWFIEEQVEEEAKLQAIVDLLDSGINLFQAEALLDRFE
jgi:ferritin